MAVTALSNSHGSTEWGIIIVSWTWARRQPWKESLCDERIGFYRISSPPRLQTDRSVTSGCNFRFRLSWLFVPVDPTTDNGLSPWRDSSGRRRPSLRWLWCAASPLGGDTVARWRHAVAGSACRRVTWSIDVVRRDTETICRRSLSGSIIERFFFITDLRYLLTEEMIQCRQIFVVSETQSYIHILSLFTGN